jgi:prevent-host-death family protein
MKRKSKKPATLRVRATRKPAGTPRAWTLREAKARFSEVVRLAQQRPQRVTSRGQDAVVVLSAAEYDRLQQRKRSKSSLLEFLSDTGFSELDLDRRTDLNRDIEL